MPVPIAQRRSAPRVSSGRWPNSPTYGWCPSRRSIANSPSVRPQVWHSRMQGRPVNELLDVPVERPTVDQLKIEVGRTKKDRVVTRLTGDHGKDGRSTRPATINARFIDRLPDERNGTADSSLSRATTSTASPFATVASGQSRGASRVVDTTVTGRLLIRETR